MWARASMRAGRRFLFCGRSGRHLGFIKAPSNVLDVIMLLLLINANMILGWWVSRWVARCSRWPIGRFQVHISLIIRVVLNDPFLVTRIRKSNSFCSNVKRDFALYKAVYTKLKLLTGCRIWMLRGSTWKELIPGIDDPLLSPSPGCTSTCPERLSWIFWLD